jgi:hypothetical protein
MIQAECLYRGEPAGRVAAEVFLADETTYDFTPYRSVSHLFLNRTIAEGNRVLVTLVHEEYTVEMYVTGLTERSITLLPVQG